MQRGSITVIVAALAVGLPSTTSSYAPSGVDALLFAAISAPSKISYTGACETVRIGNHASEASVYRIEHRAPDLTRRTYSAPQALAGDAVISKGDLSFSIDTRRRRVVETRNGALDDRIAVNDNYTLLLANYTAVPKPDETFISRRVAVVNLINKYTHEPTMLVRIDRETKIVLNKQEFAHNGSLISEARFEEVRFPSVIPAQDFELPKQFAIVRSPTLGEPTADTDRAVRSAGFAARVPQRLPEGFAPVEGDVIALKSVPTLHVLYSDGIRSVSLFENAKASTLDMTGLQTQGTSVSGRHAEYAEDRATALLAWSDANLHYALVGELGMDELRGMAAAIEK
jgi:negative regulator of sigma E activity